MDERDKELIVRVAAGDEKAFSELVRAYEQKVLSTSYRYVGDTSDARDMAQEVFIKVWEKASSFNHKSLFSTWLYRIVINHCLNFQVKRKRRQTEPLAEDMAEPGRNLEEKYAGERKAGLVREALSKLRERQRMALILSKFEGKSYQEISEIMEIPLTAVQSLIFRAKEKLRRILTPMREKGEI